MLDGWCVETEKRDALDCWMVGAEKRKTVESSCHFDRSGEISGFKCEIPRLTMFARDDKFVGLLDGWYERTVENVNAKLKVPKFADIKVNTFDK